MTGDAHERRFSEEALKMTAIPIASISLFTGYYDKQPQK